MVQKKENLRRMLEGQPHEHIPVSFFQHLKPEELHGEAGFINRQIPIS